MIDPATLTPNDRQDLIVAACENTNKHPVIMEKDFWVSWLLNVLFTDKHLKEDLIFKGGTSLSKAYGLIDRFSEDIDLIVRYERLGFVDQKDPHRPRSRTKQQRINQEALGESRAYIRGDFRRLVTNLISDELIKESGDWSIQLDPNDPDSLLFNYPQGLNSDLSYIAPQVKLELGPHAATVPQQEATITPYLVDALPGHVEFTASPVATIAARRTFWEKVTILHAEAHRTTKCPGRYSRHYYDTAMIARNADILYECTSDPALLEDVRQHKTKFYYAQWARYDLAEPGSLRLLPDDAAHIRALEKDYRDMQSMFFTSPPPFADIIAELTNLESILNLLAQ